MVPSVILATKNGKRIAARHPLAIVVDFEERKLRRGRTAILVTSSGNMTTEFKLAALICASVGKIISYDELVDALWDDDPSGGPLRPKHNLYVYVCRIRKLLPRLGLNSISRYGKIEIVAASPLPEAIAA